MNDIKVGDYEWTQVSMWESTPENCIEKYVRSDNGSDIFHFYLRRCYASHFPFSKWETVLDDKDVPEEILKWRCDDYKVKATPSVIIKQAGEIE